MAFDVSELNAACLDPGFSDEAVAIVNDEPVSFNVIFNEEPDYEEDDGFRIRNGNRITAETVFDNYQLLDRNHELTINSNTYRVVTGEPRGGDWVAMVLERVES